MQYMLNSNGKEEFESGRRWKTKFLTPDSIVTACYFANRLLFLSLSVKLTFYVRFLENWLKFNLSPLLCHMQDHLLCVCSLTTYAQGFLCQGITDPHKHQFIPRDFPAYSYQWYRFHLWLVSRSCCNHWVTVCYFLLFADEFSQFWKRYCGVDDCERRQLRE